VVFLSSAVEHEAFATGFLALNKHVTPSVVGGASEASGPGKHKALHSLH